MNNLLLSALVFLALHKASNCNQHLQKCLLNIIEKHFEQSNTIAVLHNSEKSNNIKHNQLHDDLAISFSQIENDIIKNLYKTECFPLNIINSEREVSGNIRPVVVDKYEGYIFISRHQEHSFVIQDFEQQILKLKNNKQWDPYSKVIATANVRSFTKQLAEDVFALFWKWNVINIIVVMPAADVENYVIVNGSKEVAMFSIYAWFPFTSQCQCGETQKAIVLDTWVLNDNEMLFLYNVSLFNQRIPRMLNGCPLLISIFEFPPMVVKDKSGNFESGIDMKLINELTRRNNMSIVFIEQTDGTYWGVELGNGSWNGVTGDVMNSQTDIAMGNWYYRCHVIDSIECIIPYLVDEARWFIPCAKPYPRWASLTRVFKLSLWLGFLASFIAVVVIMYFVVRVNNQISAESAANKAYADFAKCCLNFWAIILEESSSNNPPKVFVIRTMFITWVIYCWAINTVYQTYLTSFLVDPGLQHQLSSEEEMLTSGINYGIPSTMLALFPELNSKQYHKHIICDDFTECQDRVGLKGNLVLFFSRINMDYVSASRYMDGNGKSSVCIFDEVYSKQLVSMPVQKGSFLLERMNQVSMHAMEGGFLDHWWNEIKYMSTLTSANKFNTPSGEYIKLTLNHLQSAFYFLFIGCALSLITFIFEIMFQL
ncbi:hypothetical protein L9F63_005361, partial [Diploptera punctata]